MKTNKGVPEYKVPERVPPMKKIIRGKELKSMVEAIPDDAKIWINGKLVNAISSLSIEYEHYNAKINLELEE